MLIINYIIIGNNPNFVFLLHLLKDNLNLWIILCVKHVIVQHVSYNNNDDDNVISLL